MDEILSWFFIDCFLSLNWQKEAHATVVSNLSKT